MADCDGFVLIEEETLECPRGTSVPLLLTRKVDFEKRILFQGSNDPAFERITSFVREHGADIVMRSVGSLGGISALSRGEGHLAACHLLEGESGTYNDSFIERLQGPEGWERILLFWREQGIMVRAGNPKGLKTVADLTGDNVSIVNRQPGAGTRVLLDYLLASEKIPPSEVWGYDTVALTHLDAAGRVASGQADAALGIRAAAVAMKLDFIPLAEEPYELVIPKRFHDHPGIEALRKALEDSRWKEQVDRLGGYRWPD
jgi:putative molybdopterin biosynthesis protein